MPKNIIPAVAIVTALGTGAWGVYAFTAPHEKTELPQSPTSFMYVEDSRLAESFSKAVAATQVAAQTSLGSITQTSVAEDGQGTPTLDGDALFVVPANQPISSLLPQGALGVPFTSFIVKAGNQAVEISQITVGLKGFGNTNIFDGISIATDAGEDFGDEKLFRSDRKAVFSGSISIPAHAEVAFTVYGSAAEELQDYEGQMPQISVETITASSVVRGEFPIVGAMHTVNTSLRIGSATALLSQFDPGTSRTNYINDTDVRFAGIRITAGTAENLLLSGITFEQTGTAGPEDVKNVSIVVNGVPYAADEEDREYSVSFPSPILIEKGQSTDVFIRGDVTTSGSNRTLTFEIGAPDDIELVGAEYGFQTGNIAPEGNTATSGGSVFITSDGTTEGDIGDPFFSGSEIFISGGAITSIGKN